MTATPTSSDLAQPRQAYIFECSSNTYLDCVERSLFGSNKPWPLEITAGDYWHRAKRPPNVIRSAMSCWWDGFALPSTG